MLTSAQEATLDSLNSRTARLGELTTLLDRCEKVVAVTWDFAVDGGAHAADITLNYTFEEAAIVTKVLFSEVTNVTSGGAATLKLKAGSTDLTGDVAYTDVAAVTAPALAGSAVGIAVASGSALKLDIGTANATAGKVRFYVYMLPDRDM